MKSPTRHIAFLLIILAFTATASAGLLDKLRFRTGIDIARGPEQWTIYLQFGHAWGF